MVNILYSGCWELQRPLPTTLGKRSLNLQIHCLLTTFGGQSEASDWGERISAGGLPWNIGLTSPMMELGGVIRSLGEEAVFSHTSGGGGELLASCLMVLMGAGASLSPLPAGARGLARAATSSLPFSEDTSESNGSYFLTLSSPGSPTLMAFIRSSSSSTLEGEGRRERERERGERERREEGGREGERVSLSDL